MVRTLAEEVREEGFAVLRGAVPSEMCEAVVRALRDELGLDADDPSTWDRISPVIDQAAMWGHQSQWDIRQLPNLHAAWAELWGTERLWVSVDSCRFSPPWNEGRCRPLPLHWDHDPFDWSVRYYQGVVSLAATGAGGGGFRCVPALFRDQDRWPHDWAPGRIGPASVEPAEVVEVPTSTGDVVIWDSRLPHANSLNASDRPRVAFYLQYFPPGDAAAASERLEDYLAGRAPVFFRNKPGHDRVEPWPPARLTRLGRRLLGAEPWPME